MILSSGLWLISCDGGLLLCKFLGEVSDFLLEESDLGFLELRVFELILNDLLEVGYLFIFDCEFVVELERLVSKPG